MAAYWPVWLRWHLLLIVAFPSTLTWSRLMLLKSQTMAMRRTGHSRFLVAVMNKPCALYLMKSLVQSFRFVGQIEMLYLLYFASSISVRLVMWLANLIPMAALRSGVMPKISLLSPAKFYKRCGLIPAIKLLAYAIILLVLIANLLS